MGCIGKVQVAGEFAVQGGAKLWAVVIKGRSNSKREIAWVSLKSFLSPKKSASVLEAFS